MPVVVAMLPSGTLGAVVAEFPEEPVKTFSVAEVRDMSPFCGVYFAYNSDGSCHYIGESTDVTSRVVGSRQEIGERRIGFIKCEPHERKRIEAYFVALFDPPGNACSTHRMRAADKRSRAMHSSDPHAAKIDAAESLADCLASVVKRGPQSKQNICDIASAVVPNKVLLRITNEERLAKRRQPLGDFGPHPCLSKQWACERISRFAIEILVRAGKAQFDDSGWVLSSKESEPSSGDAAR